MADEKPELIDENPAVDTTPVETDKPADPTASLELALAVLIDDKETLMPPGGLAERDCMIATLQQVIDEKKTNQRKIVAGGYNELKQKEEKIGHLAKVSGLLQWYRDTERRDDLDDAISTLDVLIHDESTDSETACLIANAENENIPDAWDKRNFEISRNDFRTSRAIPGKLVGALSNAVSKCYALWPEAKKNDDFNAVREPLRELIDLTIEQAQICGDVLGCSAYDAQLKMFAPGNTQALIDSSFDELGRELPPLVQEIVEKQKSQGPVKKFHVDPTHYVQMNQDLAKILGFDFNRGRLDSSPHPFSGGTKYDTRMTTHFNPEKGVIDSLYGTVHETGHSNYTQNNPAEWENHAVGSLRDMSIHESQSMMLERSIGGHPAFLEFLYGFIGRYDPKFAEQGNVEEFIRSQHEVTPSLIRIEADAVTYPLHPMFRYDIEKKLFAKEATVDDIPELWNGKVKEYLNIDVPNNREGCLQDVHWHCGLYGYFPTYSQGALYQAQLFAAAKNDIQNVDEKLRNGDVGELNAWSKDKIHRWGLFYDAAELIKNVTGSTPNAAPWLKQTRERYLG